MEGNACYKFSTIRQFIEATGGAPVRTIVDVGANVGSISLLAKSYFPEAAVYAFEPVREYFELARANTSGTPGVRVFYRAVTAQHLFRDDFGALKRKTQAALTILKGTPDAGPGWAGGSIVVPGDNELLSSGKPIGGYARTAERVRPITLDRLVAAILRKQRVTGIDILKMDCEGCEHSCLGSARLETLRKVRFIVGEYHGIERFFGAMRNKLFKTHKVNLIGQSDLGAFFAERREGNADGILRHDNSGMLQPRPWLCATPLEWHLFDERYVLPEDRCWHALA